MNFFEPLLCSPFHHFIYIISLLHSFHFATHLNTFSPLSESANKKISILQTREMSIKVETNAKKALNWPLLIISCFLLGIGIIGGPLISRLYYLHGGNRRWITTCMQTAGFPVLFVPLVLMISRSIRSQTISLTSLLMEPKLFFYSAIIGIFLGVDNFMYSLGISFIPVSTSSLLYSTQLAFTAFFAWIIVKQKFTAFSINAVVLMTLGAVMLGLRSEGDRPAGVTNSQYFFGFFLTLGSAALLGLMWPCVELCYARSNRKVNFQMVLQFQLNLSIFATIFSLIGMLVNKDFQAMGRESNEYGLGSGMYYVVLIAGAVVWQCSFIGSLGVIFCTGSLFNGVMGAVLVPLTQVAGVIAYHETFNGEKGMALALCLWGFASYFFGEYKIKKISDTAAKDQQSEACIV